MITLLNKFDDNYVMDKKDVLNIASSYIKEYNIEPYLKDVIFTSKDGVIAHYNITTREIVLNDERIMSSCYKLYDGLKRIYPINDNHYTYFLNFYYLHIIYHELMHVSQKAIFEKNSEKDDVRNYLYILCSILNGDNRNFYKANHDIFPMEIEANNFGYLTAYNLMNYTKLPNKETRIMYLQYLFSLLFNYEKKGNSKIITPIEKLASESKIVDLNIINSLLDKTRLSKMERMNLGLSITSREYESIQNEKYKTLSKTI